jgi:hypothetical protein
MLSLESLGGSKMDDQVLETAIGNIWPGSFFETHLGCNQYTGILGSNVYSIPEVTQSLYLQPPD